VWGRNGSVLSPYQISGNWFKDGITSVQNMFFTNTSQATLKTVCQNTFALMGVSQPLMMMAAADTPTSFNYTIWTNDTATQPAKVNKVIVFGDSVSDNQNVYNATHWVMPTPHSYFLGRFTNGKVWNEYLTDKLGLPNYNWAVGGAAADDYYVVPGVVSQVQSYLNYMTGAPNYLPANTLFTMLIGGNDLINYGRTVDSIVASETQALEALLQSGAKNILMLNVPDLSRSPRYADEMGLQTPAEREALKANVLDLNQRLVTLRDSLQTKWGSGVRIRLFDTKATVDDLFANSAGYGLTNTTQSCLDINDTKTSNYAQSHATRPGCTDADAYIFWDPLHPTTRSHKLIADKVLPFVKANFPVQ
jgi:thermolabile hemolysin